MTREVEACLLGGGNGAFREVVDLLHLGNEPPEVTS
jgi:3-deoxy-D-manno-octulosonate 8-phosphate phosphatase KdsC-like HAD superfamily phosphatase